MFAKWLNEGVVRELMNMEIRSYLEPETMTEVAVRRGGLCSWV
jgi:hypothetical protein